MVIEVGQGFLVDYVEGIRIVKLHLLDNLCLRYFVDDTGPVVLRPHSRHDSKRNHLFL